MCSISAISVLQFVLKRWRKDHNKIQEKNESQQIATNDEPHCKGAFELIILDVRKPCLKRSYGNQNPSNARVEREDRTGQPVVGSDPKTASDYYHEQSMGSSFSEWKTDTSMFDRSEQPVVTSWGKTRESQSSFFLEKTQRDGTAQSIVNEVIPRDRKGQPVVIPQRGARSQQFVIGNDETELELSVESRSFPNRVYDQVRKRQNDLR